jgi:epoxide hydrolase 4
VVILLHGFPEFWYGWRRQISPLAESGLRVIVPDQRGYNDSDKPPDVRSYSIHHLCSDVMAIADQLRVESIFLAGHDWGAGVAWNTAMIYPDRVRRLAILNVPHPAVMPRYLVTKPRQLFKSWYVFFFQIPVLPEMILSAQNFRVLESSLVQTSRDGTFSREDLQEYRTAWSKPSALTGMINWYRAALRYRPKYTESKLNTPTLILWGRRDRFLMADMAGSSLEFCSQGRLITFDASHWVHHEEADAINTHLIDWFGGK